MKVTRAHFVKPKRDSSKEHGGAVV
jgi:hypothetical protein